MELDEEQGLAKQVVKTKCNPRGVLNWTVFLVALVTGIAGTILRIRLHSDMFAFMEGAGYTLAVFMLFFTMTSAEMEDWRRLFCCRIADLP